MRAIDTIYIHCSAGHTDLDAVKRFWHRPKSEGGRGWKTGGYHKWVDYDGKITDIYPLSRITNGVHGWNANSVHIAYRGGVEPEDVTRAKDTRTTDQKAGILTAIYQVLKELKAEQPGVKVAIKGHRDASPDLNGDGVIDSWERIKECPSFDAIPEYAWINS